MSDFWISFSAVVVGFAALGVAVWEGAMTRKHNRLSLRPHLRLDIRASGEKSLRVLLSNKGIGPAIIKDYCFEVDGEGLSGTIEAVLPELRERLQLSPHAIVSYAPGQGDAMSAGEEHVLLDFCDTARNHAEQQRIIAALSRINVVVNYSSPYDEAFTLTAPLL